MQCLSRTPSKPGNWKGNHALDNNNKIAGVDYTPGIIAVYKDTDEEYEYEIKHE